MYVIALLVASLFVSTHHAYALEPVNDYAIVIDAGSTGSRCFVFHVIIDAHSHRNISSHPCGKVIPGLSSFATHPRDASAYIMPLLNIAATRIPASHHRSTEVHIKATAGMRLLPDIVQAILFNTLVDDLNRRSDMPFEVTRNSVGTIDGQSEAFFAVLASNFIGGSIDGNLHPIQGRPLLGALDMGGSSTQLIFYNGTRDAGKIHAGDFWSHSWLNYGVHRVQERVLDYITAQHIYDTLTRSIQDTEDVLSLHTQTHTQRNTESEYGVEASAPSHTELDAQDMQVEDLLHPDGCKHMLVPNPCSFLHHQLPRSHNLNLSTLVLVGTGQGEECMKIIERVIWPEDTGESATVKRRRGQPIDEIEHPSVGGHHFYAMSVYYYALDCMRQFGPDDFEFWPNPSLAELEAAALNFCSMNWPILKQSAQGANQHPYTLDTQLADRCFEVLYIITLLEKGFGFDREDRSITYALEVGGKEVEWTLGFALAEVDFSASLLVQAEEDYQRALRRQNSILYKSFHSMVVHYTNTVNAIVKIMQDVLGMFFKHSNRYWLRYKMSAN